MLVGSTPKSDTVITLGDFNAQLDKEEVCTEKILIRSIIF
jgi:hypothetical protein